MHWPSFISHRLGTSLSGALLLSSVALVALRMIPANLFPLLGLLALAVAGVSAAVLLRPRRTALWILCASLLFPYRFYIPVGPINSFSVVDLAIPAVCAVLFISRPLPVRPSWAVITEIQAIAFFVLSGALSLAWTSELTMWFREMLRMLLNLGIFFSGYMLMSRTMAKKVWRVYGELGIGAMLLAIVYRTWHPGVLYIYPQIADPLVITSWQLRLGSPTWGASNLFAGTMVAFFGIYVALALSHKRLQVRRLFGLASLGCGAIIIATISAGGIAASLISLLVVLFLHLRNPSNRKNVLFFFKLATLSVFFVFGVWVSLRLLSDEITRFAFVKFHSLIEQPGTLDRLQRIRVASAFVVEHPLGAGLGGYVANGERSARQLVHNGYLQVLVETGWFGVVTLVCLVAAFLRVNFRFVNAARGTDLEPYSLGAAACLVGFLFQMLGEPIFEATITGWLLWLLQGMVSGSQSLLCTPAERARSTSSYSTDEPQPLQG